MPRSKRDRVVTLSQTKSKGRELKRKLMDSVQECVDEYKHMYVFSVSNMRNQSFKDIRMEWKEKSRFFFGKNKVMQLALGHNAEEAFRDNTHEISQRLVGQRGLLFSKLAPKAVKAFLAKHQTPNYARSGFRATESFIVKKGPLPAEFTVGMEPMLRKLGLPTRIVDAKVTLPLDVNICEKGQLLRPEQCRLLELFAKPMATFSVDIVAHWSNKKFVSYVNEDEEESKMN